MTMTAEQIKGALDAALVSYSYDESEGGSFRIGEVLIYWDASDPCDMGWACRCPGESSALNSLHAVIKAVGFGG